MLVVGETGKVVILGSTPFLVDAPLLQLGILPRAIINLEAFRSLAWKESFVVSIFFRESTLELKLFWGVEGGSYLKPFNLDINRREKQRLLMTRGSIISSYVWTFFSNTPLSSVVYSLKSSLDYFSLARRCVGRYTAGRIGLLRFTSGKQGATRVLAAGTRTR